MIELIGGIIIGILLAIIAVIAGRNVDPIANEKFQEKLQKMLPHKMGEIAGLSDEEQSFQESLKSDLPKKIT